MNRLVLCEFLIISLLVANSGFQAAEPAGEIDAVAQELNAVAINPNYKTLNAEKVAAIQQAGFKVFPYTVNDGDNIATLIDYGVDGIISDYPERVR